MEGLNIIILSEANTRNAGGANPWSPGYRKKIGKKIKIEMTKTILKKQEDFRKKSSLKNIVYKGFIKSIQFYSKPLFWLFIKIDLYYY